MASLLDNLRISARSLLKDKTFTVTAVLTLSLCVAANAALFTVVRVTPRLGRTFTDQEGELGNERRVVISYGMWQREFGGDLHVIGAELRIDSQAHIIVGVMPEDFEFLEREVTMWTPAAFSAAQRSDDARHTNNAASIARLKAGATVQQAQEAVLNA